MTKKFRGLNFRAKHDFTKREDKLASLYVPEMLATETFVKSCSVVMDALVGGTFSSAARTRKRKWLAVSRKSRHRQQQAELREWTLGVFVD